VRKSAAGSLRAKEGQLFERGFFILLHFIKEKYKSFIDSFKYGARREIVQITYPAFIEIVLSTLFGMVDMIMVGQLSSSAISAVGLTGQPFMLMLAMFAAVNVGTTTLVAWNIGAGKPEKASAVARQIVVLNLVVGTIVSIIGFILAEEVVVFMGANEDTIKDATAYFQIVAGGLVFAALTMGITAALRGAGETKIPMFYNIGSNFLNVLGNYLLIYGKLGLPKMGVSGAALSTVISRILACLFGLYVLFSNKSIISVSRKTRYKFDFEIIKKVLTIGMPSALEQFVIQGGLTLFARTVSSLGTADFAAHQIGINISGLSFAPSMAFGVAATTLVGQSLGAGDKKKAKEYADIIHHMAIFVACAVGIIFLLFSHPFARLYNKEANVVVLAGLVLKILALAQPGQSTQLSLAGALRGAGDTMYPLYASIFGIWIFRVFVAYIFVSIFNWGLVGAWVALVLDQYTRAGVVYLRFRSGKWMDKKVRTLKAEEPEAAN
jgi:putative MATE family efflux protein